MIVDAYPIFLIATLPLAVRREPNIVADNLVALRGPFANVNTVHLIAAENIAILRIGAANQVKRPTFNINAAVCAARNPVAGNPVVVAGHNNAVVPSAFQSQPAHRNVVTGQYQ